MHRSIPLLLATSVAAFSVFAGCTDDMLTAPISEEPGITEGKQVVGVEQVPPEQMPAPEPEEICSLQPSGETANTYHPAVGSSLGGK